MNPSLFRLSARQQRLRIRADVISALRAYFTGHDFLEVETPGRIPFPAPEAHIDPITSEKWYLHTSPELCMKRMLAAGYPRIFQICRCFRRGERGDRHLSEFTLLEWYEAKTDYTGMMNFCEHLLAHTARQVCGEEMLHFQGKNVSLIPPWERLSVHDAFEKYGSLSVNDALASGRYDEIMGIEIEPGLGHEKPVFLYDYPAECGALARLKPDNPNLAERFELYICGMELCNAFTELTDPAEQRTRFETDMAFRAKSGKSVWPMPEKFLQDLQYMPQASGNALGLDRLVMLFANAEKIDDVVAFTPEEL
ncbi:MAG: EF-P lysine aminoacylase EpmA [Desulfococcaceae bacterium]